jgi:hypothetical protein
MDRKRYLALINPAIEIVAAKHEDYGNQALGLESYFPFGDKSYLQMMHVKMQRLISLAQSEEEPNFESMHDTVLDLINYAVFFLDTWEQDDDI